MTDAADPDPLVFECDLDASPEKVWRAISTPELREAWLGEPDGGASHVTHAEPGERLDLAWPTREGDSLVSFEIEPADAGGTHLTIIHRALAPKVVPLHPRRRRIVAFTAWKMAA